VARAIVGLIFYRATAIGVEVVRVRHGAQDIDDMFTDP
jgi:plasmid stabilization system protein ParE